ncbi:MAG TPA: hypothetical protein VHV51_08475 [Polyangiaceae bacterium]|nr:hypothetical protein [Polyangiaceae bacterium]
MRFANKTVRARSLLVIAISASAALLAPACIYDADHRCGPSQHLGDNSSCVCDDGLVLAGQDCVPCGENETWQNGVCVCSDGYTRSSSDGGACVLGGPGSSCDPDADASSCTTPDAPICRDRGGGVGYCTTSCTADSDCPHGFACDTTNSPATCKTAAVGEGDPCTSAADCAGKDASYCETALVHVCLVPGCSVASSISCSEGWTCCDVRPLGLNMTLCTPEGECPTMQ